MNVSIPRIDGYTRLRQIGVGGSATVFRARQERLERDVAIKVLRPATIDERTRQLFDAERRMLGQLSGHSSIVSVYDSGLTADGDPYLVMELCPGGSLATLIKQRGPLDTERAVRVGSRIASALAFAHRAGCVHRDVKPENVLISELGEPLLSDFGIATVLANDTVATERAFSPQHVAPEHFRGKPPSAKSDLYSFGSTLFTVLAGHAPHQLHAGERLSVHQVLARVDDPHRLPNVGQLADAPHELRVLLQQLLAKDPNLRLETANDALDRLLRIEALLGIERRDLALPTVDGPADRDPFESFDSFDPSDPDTTFQPGHAQVDDRPRFTAGVARSTADSAHSLRTGGTDSWGTTGSIRPLDADLTVVASTAVTPSAPNAKSGDQHQVEDELQSGSSSALRFAIPVVCAAVALSGWMALRWSSGSPEPEQATAPYGSDSQAGDAALIDGVSRPRSVEVRGVGGASIEVSWLAEVNASVKFEVEVLNGATSVKAIDSLSSPVTVDGLDLASWLPCVKVAAMDTRTGVLAIADPVCLATAAPATTKVSTDPYTDESSGSVSTLVSSGVSG